MLGMEMMLKSMGLDPEEIRKGITEFGQVVIDMKNQLDRIESKLNAALAGNLLEQAANDKSESCAASEKNQEGL